MTSTILIPFQEVPAEISSLTRLVSLDISNYGISLEYPNLEMLVRNLTGLRELYLDGIDMFIVSSQKRRKWSHILSSYLPHLTSLSLVGCGLSGPLAKSFWQLHSLSILRLDGNYLSTVVPDLFTNFSNLTTLSLTNCGLKGSFPNMIFHIPTLQNLDLSWNEELSGSIPPFTQTGSLKSIMLWGTNFSGSIPTSISKLTTLEEIHLSHCQFTGSIPSTFANLTQLIDVDLSYNSFTGSLSPTLFGGLSNLVYLHLSNNSLSGDIPHSLFGPPSLFSLHLDNNRFTGQVEEFLIGNVSHIVVLDLSNNKLQGPIPDSFFQLHSLETLFLSGNMFNGSFQLHKIQSLANLTQLDLSGNNLSVDVRNDDSSTYGLPKLQDLRLSSCNLNAFPDFINYSDIEYLDLSNNRIAGKVPSWIWGANLYHLNLSFNLLTDLQKPYSIPPLQHAYFDLWGEELSPASAVEVQGEPQVEAPSPWGGVQPPTSPYIGNNKPQLEVLILGNNMLIGSIPTSLCTAAYVTILDLSVNKLNGTISSCLLENTINLAVLDVGRNNITGRIPDNISPDCSLRYLDLNNNTLEGKIPKSLQSCKQLEFMNVGNNVIADTFPCMLSSTLRVLVLHSNRFHGEVTCHKSWPHLQIVDISSNNFSGSLKSINFSRWRAMVLESDAQFKYNSTWSFGVRLIMKGLERELVKIWPEFTTIDLSCNNFKGEIPNAIGDLTSLHLLNLSHNSLNGSIPNSFGMLRMLESLDLSENQLSGYIPMELAVLTFLQVLNLSYNKLVGEIPNGRQLQTFSADSFKGNPGLCGFNLNISCSHTDGSNLSPPKNENEEEKRPEIEWEYVSAALGYVVGLGSIVWLLLFCRSFRQKYLGKIEEVVEDIFDARDRRRRRLARRARNRARRQ